MDEHAQNSLFGSRRVLFIFLFALVAIIGLTLLAITVCTSSTPDNTIDNNDDNVRVDWLVDSLNPCVICHRVFTSGIVQQFGYSKMAAVGNTCRDCHEVEPAHPEAEEYQGFYRIIQPTPLNCQSCHETEVAQFYQSRHALPAYVAMVGTESLTPEHLAMYESIPEGGFAPDKERNAIYALEGADITRFSCEGCHNIGEPKSDGSVGQCQDCHQRHIFSLEQARRPETCNAPAISGPTTHSGKSIRNQDTVSPMQQTATTGTGKPSRAV